jgi:hypothetical protein
MDRDGSTWGKLGQILAEALSYFQTHIRQIAGCSTEQGWTDVTFLAALAEVAEHRFPCGKLAHRSHGDVMSAAHISSMKGKELA